MYLVQVIFIVPLVCDVSDLAKCVQIVRKYLLYTYIHTDSNDAKNCMIQPSWKDGLSTGFVVEKITLAWYYMNHVFAYTPMALHFAEVQRPNFTPGC